MCFSKTLILPAFIGFILAGCQTNTTTGCAGWSKLRPSLETAVSIAATDRPFANAVASHNAHGIKTGCWK